MSRTQKRLSKRYSRKGGGVKKIVKKLSKKAYKSYKKYKRNANYYKQLKADRKIKHFKPEIDYPNFETDAVERFSAFRTAMEELQKDYPLLLEEYIWYSTLTSEEKEKVKKRYIKAGFDRNMWLGPDEKEITNYVIKNIKPVTINISVAPNRSAKFP